MFEQAAQILSPGLLTNQLEFLFLGGLMMIACVAIWFIIAILIAVWVYRDAQSRGMSGALWLIIVIIAGLLGLIIYIVVRKPKATPPHQ